MDIQIVHKSMMQKAASIKKPDSMMAKHADWRDWKIWTPAKFVYNKGIKPAARAVDDYVITPTVETASGIAKDPWGFTKDVGSSAMSTMAHVGTGLLDIPNQGKALLGTVGQAATDRFMPEGQSKRFMKAFFRSAQNEGTKASHNLWATNAKAQQQWAQDTGWNVPHIGNSVKYGPVGAADFASAATNTAASYATLNAGGQVAGRFLPTWMTRIGKPYITTQALLSGSEAIPALYNGTRTQVLGTDAGPDPRVLQYHVRNGIDSIPGIRYAFPLYHMQREIQKPNHRTGQPYIVDAGIPLAQQLISRPYAFNNQSWWNPSPGTVRAVTQQGQPYIDGVVRSPYMDFVRRNQHLIPTPTPEQMRAIVQGAADPNSNNFGVRVHSNDNVMPYWFQRMTPHERANFMLRVAPLIMRQSNVPDRFTDAVEGARDLQINDPQLVR